MAGKVSLGQLKAVSAVVLVFLFWPSSSKAQHGLRLEDLGEAGCLYTDRKPENEDGSQPDIRVSYQPGKVEIKGPYRAELLMQIVKRHWYALKNCYQRELAANPELEGEVVLNFRVTAYGGTEDVSILRSSLNKEEVEECMVKVVQRFRLPAPTEDGVVEATVPLTFQVIR